MHPFVGAAACDSKKLIKIMMKAGSKLGTALELPKLMDNAAHLLIR